MSHILNRKTEDRAIAALTDIINAHPTMDPHISRGDKDMSWDGYIRIFSEGDTDSEKKKFDADIPVQVKGHVDKYDKYFGKDRIQYSVEIDDLNVYFRGNGCLYFQIFISEDGFKREIYYNSLYPSKIAYYLKFAAYKRRKKTYTINFVKLESDHKVLEELCKQFSREMIYMGCGRGQIVSRMINVNDLKEIKNIHFHPVGANSPYEAIQKFSTGDVVAYGSYEDTGVGYPIGWGDAFTASMGQDILDPIGVGEKKYYDGFRLEHSVTAPGADNYSRKATDSLILSRNLRLVFNDEGMTFTFEINTDLMQISNDATFLLDMIDAGGFYIGDHDVSFYKTVIAGDFRHRLNDLKEVGDALRDIGCKVLIPFKELSENDKEQIDLLINIRKGVKGFNTNKPVFVYDWKFHGKAFPFIVENGKDGVQLIEYMFSRTLKMSYGSPEEDRGEKPASLPDDAYIVPNFVNMTAEQLGNLYYYDYDSMYDQIMDAVVNDYTEEALEHLALMLIGAYDINSDNMLLEVAKELLLRLAEAYPDVSNIQINLIQVEKRKGGRLSLVSSSWLEEMLDSLKAETCENMDDTDPFHKALSFCIEVLLEHREEAKDAYNLLGKQGRLLIDGYPIMKLYYELV